MEHILGVEISLATAGTVTETGTQTLTKKVTSPKIQHLF